MMTFDEAKASRLRNIAGACPSSDEFRDLLNEATQRLMIRGDWKGVVVPIYVCVRRGCLVFPRYVGQVRKAKLCGDATPVNNMWYRYMSNAEYSCCTGTNGIENNLNSLGYSPVFDDVQGDDRTIRAYPDCVDDVGAVIKIFGIDDDGQTLRTNNGDGTWSEGVSITLAVPYGSTSVNVRRIDRIIKPETQGKVRLYAYDTVNDVLEPIGEYEPSETLPEYAKYSLRGPGCCTTTTCGDLKALSALVKLKFIPVKTGTDLVLIDNIAALKLMIMCIKAEEKEDYAAARQHEAAAIRELNLQLADEFPDDTVPVSNNVFNNTGIGVQRSF